MCTFDGIEYRVSGRIRYRQNVRAGEVYFWTAFQLIPLKAGESEPLFLEDESNHWTLYRPIATPDSTNKKPGSMSRGDSIKTNGRNYKLAEKGHCKIVGIDGELTWLALSLIHI